MVGSISPMELEPLPKSQPGRPRSRLFREFLNGRSGDLIWKPGFEQMRMAHHFRPGRAPDSSGDERHDIDGVVLLEDGIQRKAAVVAIGKLAVDRDGVVAGSVAILDIEQVLGD